MEKPSLNKIIDAAVENPEWFKTVAGRALSHLPVDEANELHRDNRIKAFWFFTELQQALQNRNLKKDWPTLFYRSKQICCALALKIDRRDREDQSKINFLTEDWDYAVLDWLGTCHQAVSDDLIAFVFATNEIDAQEEIEQVLYTPDKELRTPFRQNSKFNIYLRKLVDWFLRRYDLRAAAKLMWMLRKTEKKPINDEPLLFRNGRLNLRALGNIFALLISLAFLVWIWKLGFPNAEFSTDVFSPLLGAYSKLVFAWPPKIPTTFLAVLYPLMIALALIALLRAHTATLLYLKLLMPRMTASIVVGYLPLVMSSDAWSALSELTPVHAFLLMSAMFLLSALFLFLEIYNTVGRAGVAFERSLTVFGVGLGQSFAIGLIVSDLVTTAFAARANLEAQALSPGLFGQVSPQVLVLMFPFALFIGFFVQVIWQDKAVTQPL